jgi:hypothetical protein
MEGQGYGVVAPGGDKRGWGEVLTGGTVRVALFGGIGLRIEGMAQIPLYRQAFVIIPYGIVHTVPQLTARMAAGFDFRF